MTSFDGLFGIIALVCGGYCIYAVILMKKTGEINKTVLLSKDDNPKKCKDTQAYLRCVIPKVMALGIITMLYGVISLVDSYVQKLGVAIPIMIVLLCIVLIWYGVSTANARKKYF